MRRRRVAARGMAIGLALLLAVDTRPSAAADAPRGTAYVPASGQLFLQGLVVRSGAQASCFDAVLVLREPAPLRLELAEAVPRACDPRVLPPSSYDAEDGRLRLPGLPVQRDGGTDCYDAVLRRVGDAPVRLELASAAPAPCASATARVTDGASFRGSVVLGSPSDRAIRANLYSADQSGTAWLSWGLAQGVHNHRSEPVALVAGQPRELALDTLLPDARYHYRLHFQAAGAAAAEPQAEASFQTARPPGSRFVFTVQGDSHPERLRQQFDPDLYVRTLTAAAADRPDFHLLLGDDFSVDTLDPQRITQEQVRGRYTLQRPWLGLIGRSAPLFLVNGNHEQAARYLLNGTPDNVAVWAQNARNALYPQPAPDAFYTGNAEQVPHIGALRNYFAWTWGDALFVVIDPYWSSPTVVDNVFGDSEPKRSNLWSVTHGDEQYQWLARTLRDSPARHKFVFAHHVLGTGRGGVEVARLWEWGGRDTRGLFQFPTQRPTWTRTIHQLFVDHGVTIFFQGHDHTWVRQQLDGVTYQTLSEPADPNYASYFDDAYQSGDKLPNSGYTRVTVAPEGVTVEYVRQWLPKDEGPQRQSGQVAFRYTVTR